MRCVFGAHCKNVLFMCYFDFFCAQGLLQSEIVQDGSNQVGFFGKCQNHGMCSGAEAEDVMKEDSCPSGGVCARTEVNVSCVWFIFHRSTKWRGEVSSCESYEGVVFLIHVWSILMRFCTKKSSPCDGPIIALFIL